MSFAATGEAAIVFAFGREITALFNQLDSCKLSNEIHSKFRRSLLNLPPTKIWVENPSTWAVDIA